MSETTPLLTLEYRGPDSAARPPKPRSPLGLVVSYSLGCGIGFACGTLAALFIHWGNFHDPLTAVLTIGSIATTAATAVMIVLMLAAVSIRAFLLGKRPVSLVRPLFSFLSGLVAGMASGAGLFLLFESERYSELFPWLLWLIVPGAAAAGGAIGLVRTTVSLKPVDAPTKP